MGHYNLAAGTKCSRTWFYYIVPGEGDAETLLVKGARLSPLESRLGWRGFAVGKGVAVEAPSPLGCTFLPLQWRPLLWRCRARATRLIQVFGSRHCSANSRLVTNSIIFYWLFAISAVFLQTRHQGLHLVFLAAWTSAPPPWCPFISVDSEAMHEARSRAFKGGLVRSKYPSRVERTISSPMRGHWFAGGANKKRKPD